MKQKILTIAALSFSLAFSAVAQSRGGTESGGGGGGICTPTKCMTLAQAGLRINDQSTKTFEFEYAVVQEVIRISQMLPMTEYYSNLIASKVLGDKETFKVLSTTSSQDFSRFKEEYSTILGQQGFESSGFELLAVSGRQVTYILPGFEKLDTRGKALLLFHEHAIRNGVDVQKVLKFDGVLLDYITASESGVATIHNKFLILDSFLKLENFYNLIFLPTTHIKVLALGELVAHLGGSVPFDEFCTFNNVVGLDVCEISQAKAQYLRKYTDSAGRVLESTQVVITEMEEDRMTALCKKNPKLHNKLLLEGLTYYYVICR